MGGPPRANQCGAEEARVSYIYPQPPALTPLLGSLLSPASRCPPGPAPLSRGRGGDDNTLCLGSFVVGQRKKVIGVSQLQAVWLARFSSNEGAREHDVPFVQLLPERKVVVMQRWRPAVVMSRPGTYRDLARFTAATDPAARVYDRIG